MKQRAAIEPIISQIEAEHCVDRNQLKGREDNRVNTVLGAAGCNFSLLLCWLARRFACRRRGTVAQGVGSV
jgi:transposase, IS5 family